MKKIIQKLKDPHTHAQVREKIEKNKDQVVHFTRKTAWPWLQSNLRKLWKSFSKAAATLYRFIRRYPYQENLRKFFSGFNRKNLKFWLPRILGAFCAVFVFWIIAILFEVNTPFDRQLQVVEIPPHTPARVVGNILEQKGIVDSSFGFRVVTKLFHWEDKIHAGEYALSPNMSLWQIMLRIREKKGVSLTQNNKVVIPEGLSILEMAQRLEESQVMSAQDFKAFAQQSAQLESLKEKFPFLQQVPIASLEGYLYPDTYQFAKQSDPALVLETMLSQFAEQIKPYQNRINASGMNLHQILTLASIIEKEAIKPEERRIISGVFHNRLKKGMFLGSCPTIKYALGKPHRPYVLFKDLKVQSPYNTYTHIGLPPGPICSPSLQSIEAALNPEQTPYLYFVAKGDGTHVFTNSNEDHIKAQQEILKENKGKIY